MLFWFAAAAALLLDLRCRFAAGGIEMLPEVCTGLPFRTDELLVKPEFWTLS